MIKRMALINFICRPKFITGRRLMSKVIYKVINQIGYITVNRPDVLNCFDYETLCELQQVIDAVY